jgi:hypothetical protein
MRVFGFVPWENNIPFSNKHGDAWLRQEKCATELQAELSSTLKTGGKKETKNLN